MRQLDQRVRQAEQVIPRPRAAGIRPPSKTDLTAPPTGCCLDSMRWVLAFAFSALLTPLMAQEEPAVGLGSRVRVRTLSTAGLLDRGFEGTIERRAGDTLVLQPWSGGASRSFLTTSDAQLFVFAGKHSMLLRGAVIGTTAGLVAAGAVGMVAGKVCTTSDPLCPQRRQIYWQAGFVLGSCGLAAGLLIGALASHDDWTRSQEYWGARPALSFGSEGMVLGLRVPF
jgi:F0F1-type ATP synthase membrane subunit c/vacuolar-type H+-ATPase subunit K